MAVVNLPIDDGEHAGVLVSFEVDERTFPDTVIELRTDGTRAVERLSKSPGRTTEASRSVATSLRQTLPVLSTILSEVRHAAPAVDEISLNLGLRVGGETGFAFVKGSADATIGITVTWRRPGSSAADAR
jgi:hypothetical protein